MNEELDSQVSAMFDGELPAAECELLARRLSRDEQLKARWGRYAVIGATIRAEAGVRLNADVARRVNAVIAKEPNFAVRPAGVRPGQMTLRKWLRPAAGLGVAAGVAALSIFWMRSQTPDQSISVVAAAAPAPAPAAMAAGSALAVVDTGEPDSYVVPKTRGRRTIVPGTQLANYVVAHSEFSSPVTRRNLLSALMAESATGGASTGPDESSDNVNDNAKNPQ